MHVRYSWMESKDGNPWSSQSHQLRLHFALPKRAILFSPWVRKHQNVQNSVLFFFFVWDHSMHMGQGSLTILDGQFRLHQNRAIILQFLHRFDIFGWKCIQCKCCVGTNNASVTKWQQTIKTVEDMWFTRWPSLQTMTISPVAGSFIWNPCTTFLKWCKCTSGNYVWFRVAINLTTGNVKVPNRSIVW